MAHAYKVGDKDRAMEAPQCGFAGALTIVFVTLKLASVIDWSWWWVLSPIWIGWTLLGFSILCVVVAHKVLP